MTFVSGLGIGALAGVFLSYLIRIHWPKIRCEICGEPAVGRVETMDVVNGIVKNEFKINLCRAHLQEEIDQDADERIFGSEEGE